MGLGRSALKNVPHFKTKITMIKMTQQKYFEVRQWSAENAVDAKHLNNQEHAAAAAAALGFPISVDSIRRLRIEIGWVKKQIRSSSKKKSIDLEDLERRVTLLEKHIINRQLFNPTL